MHFFVTIICTQRNHFLKTFILTTKSEEVIMRDFKTIFFKLFFREVFFYFSQIASVLAISRFRHYLKIGVICMTFTAVQNTGLRYFLLPLLHSLNLHRFNLNKPIFSFCVSFFLYAFLRPAPPFILQVPIHFFMFPFRFCAVLKTNRNIHQRAKCLCLPGPLRLLHKLLQ